ncbi:type 3 secretion system effector/anti-activator OspD1 [Shigella flexneri]|uniref:type 3 secretion system effector/anti-activator OspD1 n=1 Tax=Shigella flexneri TaxID=623 RepID=UPI0012BA0888|nr:type 3 secretion system effector/anti-activator OspD1 [Shigella flexneri]EFW9610722.1 hypothetical protein [Shigella flexneri]EFW9648533.1 hypothetical protein [Shigella flexneri]EFX0125326.1 hypothetical protein [Shigella flexneri]EFZ4158951.1 type 3 secretion system effector OspD1 [Shigella flexneri]EGD7225366.1 hypothetical protein [Shigella flexneri]
MSINNYGLHPANNKNMHLIIGSNTANENKGMKCNIINVTNTAISHAINEEKSGGGYSGVSFRKLAKIQSISIPTKNNKEYNRHNLFSLIWHGNADAARKYGESLLAAEIPKEEKLEVLAARNNAGESALFIALQEGHSAAIQAYGDFIKTFDLSPKETIKLLDVRDNEGVPGLFLAAGKGNIEAMMAYINICHHSGIKLTEIADRLNNNEQDMFNIISDKIQELF